MPIFQVLYFVLFVVNCGVALKAFFSKTGTGKILAASMVCVAMVALFYMLSLGQTGYFPAMVFICLELIFLDVTIGLYGHFIMKMTHVNTRNTASKITGWCVLIAGMVDIVQLALNPFFETAATFTTTPLMGSVMFRFMPCWGFTFHLVFCWFIILSVVVALTIKAVHTPKIYRVRYYIIIAVLFICLVSNLMYLTGIFKVDLSIMAYSLGGYVSCENMLFYLEKVAVENTRTMLMKTLDGAIAFFDYEDNFVDCNDEMGELFPELTSDEAVSYLNFSEFAENNGMHVDNDNDRSSIFEYNVNLEGEDHIYRCELNTAKDDKGMKLGRVLLMKDLAYTTDSVTGLEMTSSLYRYLGSPQLQRQYPVQLIAVNVNNMGFINKALGYDNGNIVLNRTADIMRSILGKNTFMARLENGSIVAVLPRVFQEMALNYADRIRESDLLIPQLNVRFTLEYGIAEINRKNNDAFAMLQEAMDSLKNRKLLSSDSVNSSLINSLTQMLMESDYETEAHVLRTKNLSLKLAEAMNLPDSGMSQLALLGVLHDIGKTGIPHEILVKPGKLTHDEWMIMKSHTERGYRIAMASPELQPIADLILHHHERWDGKGYPDGLAGRDIPLLSRIITVVDSYDVMTNDRPYHKAISKGEAIAELKQCAGSQFDPNIVSVFLSVLEKE